MRSLAAVPSPPRRTTQRRSSHSSSVARWALGLGLDPLRATLVALMLFTIGRLHQHFSFLVPLRPALLTAGMAVALAILNPRLLTRAPVFATWPAKVVGALAVLTGLSAVFGISTGQSVAYIVDSYSKVLLFWVLLVLAIRGARDLSLFIWGYILGTAFLCYLSIFVFEVVAQAGSHVARLDDEAMYMYDPNDIGVIMTVAVPLTLLMYETSKWKIKLLSVVIVGAIGWTTALGGSRGGLVGMLVVGLALLILLKQIPVFKRVAFLVTVAGALAFAAPQGYWTQMETMFNPKADYNWSSEDGRRQIWMRGIGYMLDYPVFGLGIDNFGRAEGTISVKARNRLPGTGIVFVAPHNSFIQAGAELGIPGLVLWSSLVLGGFVGMLRLRRRLPPHWAAGDPEQRYLYSAPIYIAVAFLGFAATSFFVSFAYLDPVYILAAFATGVYASVEQKRAEESRVRPVRPRTTSLVAPRPARPPRLPVVLKA